MGVSRQDRKSEMKLDIKVWILIFVVFLNLTGFGIILPILSAYAEDVGMSASMIGLVLAVYSIGQFVTSPIWGRLSDSIGRRPILIITLLGFSISYILLGFSESNLAIFLSRALAGVFAGNLSVAYSMMSDITDEGAIRGRTMGYLAAAMGTGFVIGPGLVGLVAPFVSEGKLFFATSILASFMSLMAMSAVYVYLPESLSEENRKAITFELPKMNRFGVSAMAMPPVMLSIIVMSFASILSLSLIWSILPLWAKNELGYSPQDIGYLYVYTGFISAVMQAGAIGPLMKRFSGWTVALCGFFATLVGTSILSQAFNIIPVIIGFGFVAVGAASNAVLTALVSEEARENESGFVLGVFQSAGSLGRIIGPIISGLGYEYISHTTPYYISGMLIMPVILTAFIMKVKLQHG